MLFSFSLILLSGLSCGRCRPACPGGHRQWWVAYHLMPVLYRQLAGDNGSCRPVPVFDDLQEVSSFRIGEGGKTENIKDEDRYLRL